MATKKQPRRAVIYLRLSVSQEKSVSIERQREAAEAYAEQHGWTVVGTFADDGVSASKNAPDDRAGWRDLMACREPWDVVIVWKLDRLVRRIVHFWDTYRWLEDSGKSLVSVEDKLDMTTTIGRMMAGFLAGAAEMEAEAISARVAGARAHLLRHGRVVGGTVPYGWRSVKNPNGAGMVLEQHPEQIEHVRLMVERTVAGRSLYSTAQELTRLGIPTPTGQVKPWAHTSVERTVRHPLVAGMTPFNPGNEAKRRGTDVLRGDNGLPIVAEELAVLPVAQWRAMLAQLDNRDSPQAKPRSMKAKTSGVLSGLVFCAEHAEDPQRMWRGTLQGRPAYNCPVCSAVMSNFEHLVIEEFLRTHGEHFRLSVVEEVHDGASALLPEIELAMERIREQQKDAENAGDDERYDELEQEYAALRQVKREAQAKPAEVRLVERTGTETYGAAWAAAETDEEKRDVIGDALERVWVIRGGAGKKSDAAKLARLVFEWRSPATAAQAG